MLGNLKARDVPLITLVEKSSRSKVHSLYFAASENRERIFLHLGMLIYKQYFRTIVIIEPNIVPHAFNAYGFTNEIPGI